MTEPSAESLRVASRAVDFEPLVPCAFGSGFEVTAVFSDLVPEGPPKPRVNFVVTREGQPGYILSQTRADVPFTAIPQSTHRIEASFGDVTGSGFAGPAGTGEDIAYLRWRVNGVTFELAATLHPWLTERDTQAIASSLIEASVMAVKPE